MTPEKIQWKVPLENPGAVDAWDFFRAFSAWIPDSPEIFIDVADYRHVQDGVKIVLVGHYFDVSLDDSDGVTGLVCSYKRGLTGNDDARFDAALTRALASCRRLENDPVFAGKLKFKNDALRLTINDRATAPNTPESFARFKPAVENAVKKVVNRPVRITHLADPKRRFGVSVELL